MHSSLFPFLTLLMAYLIVHDVMAQQIGNAVFLPKEVLMIINGKMASSEAKGMISGDGSSGDVSGSGVQGSGLMVGIATPTTHHNTNTTINATYLTTINATNLTTINATTNLNNTNEVNNHTINTNDSKLIEQIKPNPNTNNSTVKNEDKTKQENNTVSNTTKTNTTSTTTHLNKMSTPIITTNNASNSTTSNVSNTNQTKSVSNKTQQTIKPTTTTTSPPTSLSTTIVTTAPPSSSPCLAYPNTIQIQQRCLCRVGYINVSNTCLPLTNIMIPITDTPVVKVTTACSTPMVYDQILNKCVNQVKCKNEEEKIQGKCYQCTKESQQVLNGQEMCYITAKTVGCRQGYIPTINNTCIKCTTNSSTQQLPSCQLCTNATLYSSSTSTCTCPLSTCLLPTCGNSKLDPSQQCDDGNHDNNDGCSSLCRIESGYHCGQIGNKCVVSQCGDGRVEGGQQCDDGNKDSRDGCSSICLIQYNYTCMGSSPTLCLKGNSANLTLFQLLINSNNIFLTLQLPFPITFPHYTSPLLFFTFIFPSTPGTPYCQQHQQNMTKFDCLIVYPRGVPVTVEQYFRVEYKWEEKNGGIWVEIRQEDVRKGISSRRGSS